MRRCAFTLVELLVVIAIIAVLLGLLVPGLAKAKVRASEMKSLANLRTISAQTQQYQNVYGDRYPFIRANQPLVVTPLEDTDAVTFLTFGPVWDLSSYWHALMHSVAPWRESYAAWVSPGSPRDRARPWDIDGPRGGLPSYILMPAFFARPGTWAAGAAPHPGLLSPVRGSDVLFPSKKVMMFDIELAYRTTQVGVPRGMLFADAHAQILQVSASKAPGVNVFTGSSERLFDTHDGAHGIDY